MADLGPGDARDFLERYARAREGRDVDAAMELYASGADLRDDPFAEHVAGELAIRAWWNRFAAERANVEFDVERSWANGPTVLASWHGAWTRRATAQRIRERGFVTFELDEAGLVAVERHWTVERSVGVDGTFQAEAAIDAQAREG
jgi:limonene-1,2-epoxide hydrolase